MTLKDDEREAMRKLYMEKAHEALQEARLGFEAQHLNLTVSRSYYSMFYAAQSALIADGAAGIRTHEGVNNKFSDLFVKTGKFPKEIFRTMGNAETNRYKADYDPEIKFSPQEAEEHLEKAETFVDAVEKMYIL